LVNVSTGETFRIADFQGKVVLVETMAMWCSNCLKQQQQVKALHELMGERDDFISVGLDIDINEDAGTLAKYVERNSFDWIYVVVPAEVGRDLGNLYGNQFLNPPSTPMLIIDAKGEVHPLPFGIKSAEKLLEALEPFLTDSM
jgi:thiol-disulfide isomerase/thioredoxin